MTRFAGCILVGGLLLATSSTANAQFSLQIGNAYGGGLAIGSGGYGYPGYYGYGSPVTSYYSSGYVAPGVSYFGSGLVAPSPVYGGYGYRPYGYGGYGYRNSYGYGGYGYRRGGIYRGWGGRRGGLFR